MRKLILIILLGTSAFAFADQVDQTLKVDADGNIRIDVVEGDVSIIGWDKQEVRVVGKVPNGEELFVFKTNGSDTRIEVESEHGFWGNHGGGASLKIYSPLNSSIRSDGASTDYNISGIIGSVRVSTMSGDIDLVGGEGKVDLESISGDINVKDAKGRLNLASVSGDMLVNALASLFDAQTVSGNIAANVGSSDKVELESVSGDIDLRLSLADDGRLDANTVSGNINVRFDNDEVNASFDIETGSGGDIRNLITDDKGDSTFAFSGSLEFQIGNGNSSVNIETMSGTVTIEK